MQKTSKILFRHVQANNLFCTWYQAGSQYFTFLWQHGKSSNLKHSSGIWKLTPLRHFLSLRNLLFPLFLHLLGLSRNFRSCTREMEKNSFFPGQHLPHIHCDTGWQHQMLLQRTPPTSHYLSLKSRYRSSGWQATMSFWKNCFVSHLVFSGCRTMSVGPR